MLIYNVKGFEFLCVFLFGVSDGILFYIFFLKDVNDCIMEIFEVLEEEC